MKSNQPMMWNTRIDLNHRGIHALDLAKHCVHTQAIAAVDIALWDALGKSLNQPVSRLLGDARSKVPVIAIGGYVMNIPRQDIDQALTVLVHDFGASEVWLFGSAATGTADEHSDIDLRVVRSARDNSPRPSVEARLCLSRHGLRRPFDLLVLTPERWREVRRNPVGVYEEIVKRGVKLHEG